VPPSGFLSPSAVSAATPRLTRVSPDPLETPLHPQLCGLVSCRKRPWDSPFRAFPSRGAVPPFGGLVLPCGFDRDCEARREGARFVAIAFRRAPISSRAARSRRAPRTRQQDRERDFPRSFTASLSSTRVTPRVDLDQSLEAACPPRESPRASTSTTDLHTRARRLSAVPPASKLCSPRESVHAATTRSLELAPELMSAHRADALLGFALLKPSPPRPRVRSTARNPGEPVLPGRPRSAPDG